MHIHFLDPFQPGESPIHQVDPRVKFVLTIAFIFSVALTPSGAWPAYILLLSIIISVEILSDLGVINVQKRSIVALPFVLAALPIIFTLEGDILTTINLGPWSLSVFLPGLERFISIALKSWISVQAAIVLAESTPFPDLLAAMRAVKIPRLLVAIFSLMWRYLFVLADEALRLFRARSSRSSHSDIPELKTGGSIAWRARVAGGMVGSLFIRAFERSDRIYMAMISRGYDGEVRSLPLPKLKTINLLIMCVCLIALSALLVFAYLFWA
jgi:cobalt/nickel transport system permease protein